MRKSYSTIAFARIYIYGKKKFVRQRIYSILMSKFFVVLLIDIFTYETFDFVRSKYFEYFSSF